MRIPAGVQIDKGNNKDFVMQLHRNIYGQKQAGRVWYNYLVEKLLTIGFVQSSYDQCLFYRGQVVYVLYTDDSILAGPVEAELDQVLTDLK